MHPYALWAFEGFHGAQVGSRQAPLAKSLGRGFLLITVQGVTGPQCTDSHWHVCGYEVALERHLVITAVLECRGQSRAGPALPDVCPEAHDWCMSWGALHPSHLPFGMLPVVTHAGESCSLLSRGVNLAAMEILSFLFPSSRTTTLSCKMLPDRCMPCFVCKTPQTAGYACQSALTIIPPPVLPERCSFSTLRFVLGFSWHLCLQ